MTVALLLITARAGLPSLDGGPIFGALPGRPGPRNILPTHGL